MDLDRIRTGCGRTLGGVREILDGRGDVVDGERPWDRSELLAGRGVQAHARGDRRRRDRDAVMRRVVGMSHPPDVHQLDDR